VETPKSKDLEAIYLSRLNYDQTMRIEKFVMPASGAALNLSNLNVVIGANGTGKSRLLRSAAQAVSRLGSATLEGQVPVVDMFGENIFPPKLAGTSAWSRGPWALLKLSSEESKNILSSEFVEASGRQEESLYSAVRSRVLGVPNSQGLRGERTRGSNAVSFEPLKSALEKVGSCDKLFDEIYLRLLQGPYLGVFSEPLALSMLLVKADRALLESLGNEWLTIDQYPFGRPRLTGMERSLPKRFDFGDEVYLEIGTVRSLENSNLSLKLNSAIIPDSTNMPKVDLDSLVFSYATQISKLISPEREYETNWLWETKFHGYRSLMPKSRWHYGNYVIDQGVAAACRILSELIDGSMPDFIRDHYKFEFEIQSPVSWAEGPHVIAYLRDRSLGEEHFKLVNIIDDVEKIDALESTSAGQRRWITSVILTFVGAETQLRIDTNRLESQLLNEIKETDAFQEVATEDLTELALHYFENSQEEILIEAYFRECRNSAELLDYGFDTEERVVFVDEPEANLHPSAIRSIGRWLQNKAAENAVVIAATHNSEIFDIQYPDVSRFITLRGPGIRNRIPQLDKDISYAKNDLLEMGITQAELLLSVKRWICVEGEIDRIVIEGLFGRRLEVTGTRILPLHGAKKANYLFQAPLLKVIAGQIVVLLDSPAPDGADQNLSDLEQLLIKDLKSDLRREDLHSVGDFQDTRIAVERIPVVDMMFYLDPELLCQNSKNLIRSFDSWISTWNTFINIQEKQRLSGEGPGSKSVKEFKTYLQREHGVVIDKWTVSGTVTMQAQAERFPLQLEEIIYRLTDPLYLLRSVD